MKATLEIVNAPRTISAPVDYETMLQQPGVYRLQEDEEQDCELYYFYSLGEGDAALFLDLENGGSVESICQRDLVDHNFVLQPLRLNLQLVRC